MYRGAPHNDGLALSRSFPFLGGSPMRISVRARQLAVVPGAILWSTFAPPATAGVFYSTAGSTYSQNFDTLNADNDTVTMQGWTNDSTIAGWSLFRQPSPGTPVTFYRSSSGDSTT